MSFIPTSLMPQLSWPAIRGDGTAQLMAVLYQLNLSQYWRPKQLEAAQFAQLKFLVQHAVRYSPFYSELFSKNKVDIPEHFNQESWGNLPIVSRRQLQEAASKAVCSEVPEHHVKGSSHVTSGSTGQPLSIISTNITQMFWQAITLRDHLWHSRDLKGKLTIIRDPKGAKLRNGFKSMNSWGPPADKICPTGKAQFITSNTPVNRQLEILSEINPDYLLTYPTNLSALIRESLLRGVKLVNLKEVRTLGEIVFPTLRTLCMEAWGVNVVDNYSCQEGGYLALQCPIHSHMHVQSETVKVEILNDNNQPCEPGETGRVVLTSLHNFVNPIIRYEIGDYATVGEPCSCGRGLPVLNQIHGRVRNMMHHPNNVLTWPNINNKRLYEVEGLKQFQIIQVSVKKVQFHYVSDMDLTKEQFHVCEEIIRDCLSYKYEIEWLRKDSIERAKGGKHEDFKSLI